MNSSAERNIQTHDDGSISPYLGSKGCAGEKTCAACIRKAFKWREKSTRQAPEAVTDELIDRNRATVAPNDHAHLRLYSSHPGWMSAYLDGGSCRAHLAQPMLIDKTRRRIAMQTALDCMPCLIRQALEAARRGSAEPAVHERLVRDVMQWASEMDLWSSPPVMAQRVTLAVRGAPVLNDATLADAKVAGLCDLVAVIENGSDAPGTILDDCNDEFRKCYRDADLVIAKGQGNFETLSQEARPIFFLFKVKCTVIAAHVREKMGTLALRRAGAAV
jgi:hypothetical protein